MSESERELVITCDKWEIVLNKEEASARICRDRICWLSHLKPEDFEAVLAVARRVREKAELWEVDREVGIRGYVYAFIHPESRIEPAADLRELLWRTKYERMWVDLSEEQVRQLGLFAEPRAGRLVIMRPEDAVDYEWRLYVGGKLREVVFCDRSKHRRKLIKLLRMLKG